MKIETSKDENMKLDSQTLSTLLSHYMSNRAAAFVAVALFRQHGLTPRNSTASKAAGHSGNDKTAAALAKLSPMTLEELEQYVDTKLTPAVEAKHAKSAAEEAAYRAANPEPVWTEEDTQAAIEWWNREGKFEEELEERGETKYFHYENAARGRQGRRELTAAEYLSA